MACVDTDMVTGNHMEDGMGDLFDHIEDLLDFPSDDEDALGGLVEPCDQSGTLLLPLSVPVDGGLLGGVGGDSLHGSTNQNDKAGTALSPEEDNLGPCDELEIVQLEWMSRFFDDSDSFSLDLPSCDDNIQTKAKDQPFFRTSSPVPILEANTMEGGGGSGSGYDSLSSFSSSSSSSTSASYFDGGNNARATLPLLSPPEPRSALVIPARARSKRARPAIFSPLPHVTVPYLPPSSDVIPVHQHSAANSSDLESFGETCPSPPPLKKKKNKTKSSPDEDENGSPRPVRKCMHCEIQKTPQWRAGPMGPKTLCNACGVRYKSGRLFPEYRPAASPTFVPSLHSNSHKRVVKMRMKAGQKTAAAGAIVSSSDGCDLLDSIRRWE